MKKNLLFIVIMLFAANVFSQKEKAKEQSNADIFSAKEGSLIQKEFIQIGSLKGIKLSIMYITDLKTNEKLNALRFEYEYSGSYSTTTKIAVLDVDEVSALQTSIKFITDKIFPTAAQNYTEVAFKSRGGFEAGCYSKEDSWKTYLQLDKYDSKSLFFNYE